MMTKLRNLAYASKQEIGDDLNRVWANCLVYNSRPSHPLRKHAFFMREETKKLAPLIPDITVRDRAEIEAEERRLSVRFSDVGDSDDEPMFMEWERHKGK